MVLQYKPRFNDHTEPKICKSNWLNLNCSFSSFRFNYKYVIFPGIQRQEVWIWSMGDGFRCLSQGFFIFYIFFTFAVALLFRSFSALMSNRSFYNWYIRRWLPQVQFAHQFNFILNRSIDFDMMTFIIINLWNKVECWHTC